MKRGDRKFPVDILLSEYSDDVFPRRGRQLSVPVMSPTNADAGGRVGACSVAHLLTNFDDTTGLINIPVQNVR